MKVKFSSFICFLALLREKHIVDFKNLFIMSRFSLVGSIKRMQNTKVVKYNCLGRSLIKFLSSYCYEW